MKFKLTKSVKIVVFIGILFILAGVGSYKIYFEKLFIFQENEKIFLESVENYFVINKLFLPKANNYKTVTLQDMYDNALIEALHVPKSNKFCNEDNSFVRAINEKGVIRYVVYLDCGKFKSKVDYTSPVIVLNGDKKVIVNLYDKYSDSGIKTVVDDYDGVIDNSKVEVYNNVDTSKPGNYEVVYKVYDKNFNVTREVRDVVVADNLNNIVKRDTNNENYYKGNVNNNYLLFSGMMFRIVKINDDGSVKIVSDDNISHVSYTESEYMDSNVRHWLNNYYLDHINENSKKYIVEGSWCVDDISDINNFTCSKKVKDKVGLLNVDEYLKSKSNKETYLDGNRQALLLNKKDSDNIYISGLLSDSISSGDDKTLIPALRPSFNLKENTYVVSGDGTISKPYMIGDYKLGKEHDLLNTRLSGEFINFSGYLMRIIGTDENGNIEVVMMEELINTSTKEKLFVYPSEYENYKFNVENSIGRILNEEYINYLNYDYLVSSEFSIPTTVLEKKYDELETKIMNAKLYLPYTYQMFSGGVNNGKIVGVQYLFSDHSASSNKIFILNTPNQITFNFDADDFYQYTIRPVMFLNKDVKISHGKGTIVEPYYLKVK